MLWLLLVVSLLQLAAVSALILVVLRKAKEPKEATKAHSTVSIPAQQPRVIHMTDDREADLAAKIGRDRG